MKTLTQILVMDALASVAISCDDPFELGLFAVRNATYFSGIEKVFRELASRIENSQKCDLLCELVKEWYLSQRKTLRIGP